MTGLFELLRFEATPVGPAVAVVEVDGTFTGPEPVRPRLLVEIRGVASELPALGVGGTPWSATFAVPLDALVDPGASFALVPGRGPLIELPSPTTGGGDDDRFVRLARTANELRHRLDEASAEAASAAERLGSVIEQRDQLAGEVTAAREQLAAAEARAAEAHDAALAAREAQAGAEGEADAARAALARARDEARAEVRAEIESATREAAVAREERFASEERAVAAEDDARAARRELKDARARIEALLRQGRTSRTAATRTRVASRTAEDHGEFRAARLGAEWADEDEPTDATAVVPDAGSGSETAPLPDDSEAVPDAERVTEEEAVEDPSAGSESDASPAAPVPSDDPATDDPTTADFPSGDTADLPADDTANLPADDTADLPPDDPTTGDLPSTPRSGPGLWSDDEPSVRILRPRTRAGRRRPATAVPADEPTDDDVLEPAAVGARLLRPADVPARRRAAAVATNPRVIVGAIFLLLIIALVLIFAGVGPV